MINQSEQSFAEKEQGKEKKFALILAKKDIEKSNQVIRGLKIILPNLPSLLKDKKTKIFATIITLALLVTMASCSPIDSSQAQESIQNASNTYYCSPEVLNHDKQTIVVESGGTKYGVLEEFGLNDGWNDGKVDPKDAPSVLTVEKINWAGEYSDPQNLELDSFAENFQLNTGDRITNNIVTALCGQTRETGKIIRQWKQEETEASQAAYEAAQYNYQETVRSGDSVGLIYQRLMEAHGFEYDEGDRISIYDANGNLITAASLIDFNQNLANGHIEVGWTVEVDSKNIP